MQRRTLLLSTTALALLGGCAGVAQMSADVRSFGDWPSGRAGSYAFDRLPSQQAQADDQQKLEDAAAAALARAGLTPVAAGSEPDLLVQVGARVSRSAYSPWDDPLWWPGGYGPWRRGPWHGPYWGVAGRWDLGGSPRYDREVALLLRDRSSGKPLYEARASSEGYGSNALPLLGPLFTAALADFPVAKSDSHRVMVPMTP